MTTNARGGSTPPPPNSPAPMPPPPTVAPPIPQQQQINGGGSGGGPLFPTTGGGSGGGGNGTGSSGGGVASHRDRSELPLMRTRSGHMVAPSVISVRAHVPPPPPATGTPLVVGGGGNSGTNGLSSSNNRIDTSPTPNSGSHTNPNQQPSQQQPNSLPSPQTQTQAQTETQSPTQQTDTSELTPEERRSFAANFRLLFQYSQQEPEPDRPVDDSGLELPPTPAPLPPGAQPPPPSRISELECETALRVLINLCIKESARDWVFKLGLGPIIHCLTDKSEVIVMMDYWLLSHVAMSVSTRQQAEAILPQPVVDSIVDILSKAVIADVVEKAVWFMTNLCQSKDSCDILTQSNVCDYLLDRFTTCNVPNLLLVIATVLRNLMNPDCCSYYAANKSIFCKKQGIKRVIQLLESKEDVSIMASLNLLCVLGGSGELTDLIRKIIIASGALPPLFSIAANGTATQKERALHILIGLSMLEGAQQKLLNAGCLGIMLDLLGNEPYDTLTLFAVIILQNLSCFPEVRSEFQFSGLLEHLKKILSPSTNETLLLHACSLLSNLALHELIRLEMLHGRMTQHIRQLQASPQLPPKVRDSLESTLNSLSVTVSATSVEEFKGVQPHSQTWVSGGAMSRRAHCKSLFLDQDFIVRTRIVKEIMSTENTYLKSLGICLNHYRKPLLDGTLISVPDVEFVFGNMEEIVKLGKSFLESLNATLDTWGPDSIVSVIFTNLWQGPLESVYNRYLVNYDKRMELFMSHFESKPTLKEWAHHVSQEKEVNTFDVWSFLILPIQRVPRYILLLQSLLKSTPSTHPDHIGLKNTIAVGTKLLDSLNEAKRASENKMRVPDIQKNLVNPPPRGHCNSNPHVCERRCHSRN
ncbi:guanine nucleotide exchange factor [Pelomyxa schiedti]|nr:guanine nucleotide exchange factor [Pelomyxa schiedti]